MNIQRQKQEQAVAERRSEIVRDANVPLLTFAAMYIIADIADGLE